MKKSKILIPVLSIAGLGATVAPIVAMTSCSCSVDPYTLIWNNSIGGMSAYATQNPLTFKKTEDTKLTVVISSSHIPEQKKFSIKQIKEGAIVEDGPKFTITSIFLTHGKERTQLEEGTKGGEEKDFYVDHNTHGSIMTIVKEISAKDSIEINVKLHDESTYDSGFALFM